MTQHRDNEQIRVLVVDDSALMSRQITAILQNDEKIQVVGWAKDGLEALNMVKSLRPDVVTMDVEMPRMNGISALKHIMVKHPIPTVMISALTVEGARTTFDALKYGAIDVIAKPSRREDVSLAAQEAEIIAKVRRAASIRTGRSRYMRISPREPIAGGNSPGLPPDPNTRFIGIGTGIGGYYALLRIIPHLPPTFHDVLVAVILSGSRYVEPFVAYLHAHSSLPVKKADSATPLEKGTCYLCSGDSGPRLDTDSDGNVRLSFVPKASTNGSQGAIDGMFESYARIAGNRAVGIIMTGAGADGAEGLSQIREAGGTTVIQDINNCVDPSMPLAVLEKGPVSRMLPDYLIADFLINRGAPEN
jgi:two-component system, chemotaxis family, protein-glutamate methylesterase/glutaminase